MNKTFTLVIPTFNSSSYVEELIDSATNLKYLNEIIISDDCSESNEFEILKNLINKEKYKKLNIKLHKNSSNLGGFRNKLKGVELSSNELIYQVDSDNIISKKTEKFLNNEKNLKLVSECDIFLQNLKNLTAYSFLDKLMY